MANDVQPLNLHTKSIGVKAILLVFLDFHVAFNRWAASLVSNSRFCSRMAFPKLSANGLDSGLVPKSIRSFGSCFGNENFIYYFADRSFSFGGNLPPAAYASARYNYWGRRTFLIMMFASNAFPKIGLFATIATLYYFLNLMGTVVGVIIVQVLGTIIFMTWIPAAAFAAVPKSLEEAARDAGAGKFRVFRTITLKMAMPGILVAMVMSFIYSFDEAQGTYLVGAPQVYTMPTAMYAIVETYPIQVTAVFSILLTIPSVFLLGLARKHIIGGQLAEGFQIK